LFDTMTMVQLV